jgi:hypothetical protein
VWCVAATGRVQGVTIGRGRIEPDAAARLHRSRPLCGAFALVGVKACGPAKICGAACIAATFIAAPGVRCQHSDQLLDVTS